MLSICIRMPSGSSSKPRNYLFQCPWVILPNGMRTRLVMSDKKFDDDSAAHEIKVMATEMKQWPDFEARIVLFEDDVEISSEHIKT